MKKGLVYTLVFAGAVNLLLVANYGSGATVKLNPIKPGANQAGSTMTDEQQAIAAVRKAKAAVVSIVGSPKVSQQNGGFTLQPLENSFGTGFIVESNGYIVSNSHVVNSPNTVYSVVLLDGKKFPATVVGLDKYSDIALLKIEAAGLATLSLGNSDQLETGQSVFAIGNALGRYQNSVTRGVVSALDRNVAIEESKPRLQNLIQTDAAINPGNSGGPLINLSAEVVGMNTVIDTGGSGLGFAIPSNVLGDTIRQLRAFGKASHPYLGITYASIDASVRLERGLADTVQGALVLSVSSGSPAASARLAAGDILTAISSEKISELNELDKVVQRFKAGDQVMLSVVRNGERLDVPVVLGEYK